jgi:TusE/DsrC/DsvC family sulfur relay protein
MPSFDFKGKTYEIDEDGYLLNLDDWNEDVALYIAEQEEVEMTPAHWEVINFLRDYYAEYKIAPMIKILVKALGEKLGPEKGNTKYLYELYPAGPAKQACKIAGLPKPTGCVYSLSDERSAASRPTRGGTRRISRTRRKEIDGSLAAYSYLYLDGVWRGSDIHHRLPGQGHKIRQDAFPP